MKSKILFFLLSAFSVISLMTLNSCKKDETASGEKRMLSFYITPNKTVAELKDSIKIEVVASFSDGSMSYFTDSAEIISSDPSVVKVEKGVAVGLKEGTVKLTARYRGLEDTCTFVSSEVAGVRISVYDDTTALAVYPTEVVGAGDVSIVAVFKSGDIKKLSIGPEDVISSDDGVVVVKTKKDGEKDIFDGVSVQKVQDTTAYLRTVYTTKAGKNIPGQILLCVGKYLKGNIYLEGSKRDTVINAKVKESDVIVGKTEKGDSTIILKYDVDDLNLGASSGIVARAAFSWKRWLPKSRIDTVNVLDIVKKDVKSTNPSVLGIADGTAVVGVSEGENAAVTVTLFGQPMERKISVIRGEEQAHIGFSLTVNEDYVYAGRVMCYQFYELLKDGSKSNLTNTGNDNIRSGYSTDNDTLFLGVSTGTVNLSGKGLTEAADSSLRVAVQYYSDSLIFSKPVRFYAIPDTAGIDSNEKLFFGAKDGFGLTHNDFSIVDDAGNDCTKDAKVGGGRIVLDKCTRQRIYTLYYGPEKLRYQFFVE